MDNVYEYAQSLHLEDALADLCRTKEEVDAVILCKEIIDDNRDGYLHALAHQPKDTTGRRKKLDQLLSEAKNPQEQDDIISEWEAVYHWRSSVKDIKDDILVSCKQILIDASIGKKQRLKLIPKLTKYLTESKEPSTDEKVQTRLFLNKIEKLLSKI